MAEPTDLVLPPLREIEAETAVEAGSEALGGIVCTADRIMAMRRRIASLEYKVRELEARK